MTLLTQEQVTDPASSAAEHERHIPMTYEQFRREVDETTHAEWVNGEATIFMPPTTEHQRIVRFLVALLDMFIGFYGLGELFSAPFEMRATSQGSGREPDILFVEQDHIDRIGEKRLEGPADLIVEVISPESARRDRSDKFYEYQDAGVREYWVIDPRQPRPRADFWVLDANGLYRPVPVGENGVYRSTVLTDLWINVNWLWQEELPDTLSVFAQVVGPERLIDFLQRLK